MKRERPNTRAMLAAPRSGSSRDELAPDDLEEARWNEFLSEHAREEDTDPFTANNEIQSAHYLVQVVQKRAARNTPNSKSPNEQSGKRDFWALCRRKKGIAGIRVFLDGRFQECNRLLQRLPKLQKLRQIELLRKAKKKPEAAQD